MLQKKLLDSKGTFLLVSRQLTVCNDVFISHLRVKSIRLTVFCSADKITQDHLFYHTFELQVMISQCFINGKGLKIE